VLIEAGHIDKLIDYTTWTVGTGSVAPFVQYGLAGENDRIVAPDPWGRDTIVWTNIASGDGGQDGGFYTTSTTTPIDNTKLYRFSIWARRTTLGSDGDIYFGALGYIGAASNGLEELSTGNNNTSSYFWSHPQSATYTPDEWILIVGHVFPYTTSTGTSDHADSGRYHPDGNHYTTSGSYNWDYRWRSVTTTTSLRVLLYNDFAGTARQRWCYPRIDVVDGTEPTINKLLSGNYYEPHW